MTPLEQIKVARDEAKNLVELADDLDKLRKTRAFKNVFEDYILKDLPLQAAGMFKRPGNSELAQESLESLLAMVSMLNHTLSTIYTKAEQAQNTLVEIDQAEAEWLSEGVE
jgi:hypothetical protein